MLHSNYELSIDREAYDRVSRSPNTDVEFHGHKVSFDITGESVDDFLANVISDPVDFTYFAGMESEDGFVQRMNASRTDHVSYATPTPDNRSTTPENRSKFRVDDMRDIEQTARAKGEFSDWYIEGEGQAQELDDAIEKAESRTSLGILTPEGDRVPEGQISDYLEGYY
jgi:hypothetical protein